MPEIVLKGCTPEPLMHYLKALGVLRLVAEDVEHGDPSARGQWQGGAFVLSSRLDERELECFFERWYRPTPIVVPWSGGDFLEVNWRISAPTYAETPTSTAVIESFLATTSSRLASYRAALIACKETLETFGIDTSYTGLKQVRKDRQAQLKGIKWRFIETLRGNCDVARVIDWIDAAALTGAELFAPILGSGGGSDGNTHFSDNFMQNLWDVLPDFDVQRTGRASACAARSDSINGLRDALYRNPSTYRVADRTSALFDSGAVGGPNATHGMVRHALSNPWDVIIGFEGTLCFASAAVKRLAGQQNLSAAFPFQFVASSSKRGGLSGAECGGREIWLPIWERPACLAEIKGLFSEGRAGSGTRNARSGLDMARSVAALGVDRGIRAFYRYATLKGRVGGENYNTAACLGQFAVAAREGIDLIREVDPWLERLRRACSGDKVPARVSAALRGIDEAIFEFCTYGGSRNFQGILIALGVAERALATSARFTKESRLEPLAGLSPAWLEAADMPDDAEFEIALALAGIDDPEHVLGSLRTNLEAVALHRNARKHTFAKWAERDRAVVWNAADLCANLTSVLARRVMDGARSGCADLPLSSPSGASPSSIIAFLNGRLDEQRIERLVWGLMLVDRGGTSSRRSAPQSRPVRWDAYPPLYALLKLLFLPMPIVPMGAGIGGGWRLATVGERGIRIRPEPAVLALLRSGRVGEAACIAMRRLRASGLSPIPHRRSGGPSRDDVWREVRLTPREGQRLAASLLIPLRTAAVAHLIRQAIRSDGTDAATNTITLNSTE